MEWKHFEDEIRKFASIRWSRPCNKQTISGIEIDGVIQFDDSHYILMEITQNERLEKFRKDITDLDLIRTQLFNNKKIFSDCYIVTEEEITSRMLETAQNSKIKTFTFQSFKNDFFQYETYKYERGKKPFGSAVIPETGEMENNQFIKVDYLEVQNKNKISYDELIKMLMRGKKIVLKGEYGTGKSRLLQNVFFDLTEKMKDEYILAIDLRNYKGVENGEELIRRHMSRYGLNDNADNCVKCLNSGEFLFLIDGFDEIAVQSWSEKPQRLIDIRYKELGFIRSIIENTKKGIIITGREHFFNSDEELIKAFGLKKNDFIIIESKSEFSEIEINKFKDKNFLNIDIPGWFPRKPMAIRLLSNNELTDEIKTALKINSPYYFWKTFFEYITDRDADANKNILDPESIRKLMLAIARYTRNTPTNNGPISMEALNRIFKEEIGYDAIDESSAYLQRLPGIGRVASDSYDRNFTDDYFLDFLRTCDAYEDYNKAGGNSANVLWKNSINKRGVDLLANIISENNIELKDILAKLIRIKNKTLLMEFISAWLLYTDDKEVDFKNITIDGNITCAHIDFFEKSIRNISFKEILIEHLDITNCDLNNVHFSNAIIYKLSGVSSRNALSQAFEKSCDIENFEQVSSISKIKQIKLSPAQQYLVLIFQKVFNQKGSGRKEEVLTRGFNGIYDKKLAKKILNYLENEKILSTHLGDEGKIYAGNKKFLPRIEKILENLTLSKDEIWISISEFV